ncbi:MAG: ydaD [Ilumatobacteraceae bacterium]|nr:ydaD [Ilumatobacteraceae bacterium]
MVTNTAVAETDAAEMAGVETGRVETGRDAAVTDMFRLDGRTAIVTGGTRGLGFAIARTFLRAGANVVICGRTADQAEEAAATLGGASVGVAAHMGDLAAVEQLVETTVERFGGIDVVVNNAGISLGMNLEAMTVAGLQKSLDVNLIGPVMLVQAALPYLERSPSASVINVITAGVMRPTRGLSVYQAAKAGLEMMTRTMALELSDRHIRVNGISPGAFGTDMVMNMTEDRIQAAIERTPLGRMADPSEIGGAALFLASRASNFVTGTTLVVDGGMTI